MEGSPVTQIASTATGNKEYWAKWELAHTHDFNYSSTDKTITATCGNTGCDLTDSKVTLTITSPTLTTYGQTGKSAAATLTGLDAFNAATGKSIAATDIKYAGRGTTTYAESDTAPTNAGKYTAKITVEGKTATVDYEIAKAATSVTTTPTAGETTYGQTLADSTLTGGTASVAGTFAWKNTTIAPAVSDSETTEYDVVFTPTDGNYSTAECKVKLTVNKADPTNTVGQLSAFVGQTLADVALPTADNGTWSWEEDTTAKLNDIGMTTHFAKFTPNDTNNYNTLDNVSVQIEVAEKPMAVPATVTANSRTYDGTEKPLVNVDDSTLVGGTMQYALGTKDAATEEYTTSIPSKTDAGTYYVWYKAKGNTGYLDSTPACVPVTVAKAEPAVTAPTAKTLTYTGSAQELVNAGTATGGEMQYVLGTDATTAPTESLYTTSIPAKTNAGTYYVWYKVKGDENHSDTAPAGPVTVTISESVAETVTITFDEGEGTGTMAPVQIEKGSQYTFPKSSFIPPANKVFAHWKIGEKQYAVNDKITVTADLKVTAVWGDIESKIVTNDLTSVPKELTEKFSSVTALENALLRELSSNGQIASRENCVFQDAELMVLIDGEWVKATEENFPKDKKLSVTFLYPAGTGRNTHDFSVAHMFTVAMHGHLPGKIETPAVTKGEDGITVELDGLSPVAISWTKIDEKAIDSLPHTGDTERPLLYGLAVLFALIGIGWLTKKK